MRTAVRSLLFGGGPILPLAALFGNGEDGFLYGNFTDLTRQFLLSTGSSGNVAADADPEGLSLDNHSWGGASLTAILAAQTELLIAGSWTMSVAGGTSTATESPAGTLNLFCDGTNQARGDQSFATVVGRTYSVTATVSGGNTTSITAGTAQGGTQNLSGVAFSSGVTSRAFFVATATTTWVRFFRGSSGSPVISAISCKLVPGNHALQATTTKRPLWKANSGKPYLQPDGTDDSLNSPFIPTASLTMAIACQITSASKIALGGGNSTGNKRAYIGTDASGYLSIGWGTAVAEGANDRRATDMTVIVTGDASGRDVYVNGAVVPAFGSPSGAPDGTGGGLALGAFNNNGTPATFADGRIYAALALNRRVTPAEIANITRLFRSAYQ